MNNDLISREALKKAMNELHKETIDIFVKYGIEKVYDLIDNAPTVTPEKALIDKLKGGAERPQGEWIPVSERLPDDLEPVNITWINRKPAPYYKEIKDKPFSATGLYYNGQWFWWSSMCADILAEYGHCDIDLVDKDIEITHWQPLPKPYELKRS